MSTNITEIIKLTGDKKTDLLKVQLADSVVALDELKKEGKRLNEFKRKSDNIASSLGSLLEEHGLNDDDLQKHAGLSGLLDKITQAKDFAEGAEVEKDLKANANQIQSLVEQQNEISNKLVDAGHPIRDAQFGVEQFIRGHHTLMDQDGKFKIDEFAAHIQSKMDKYMGPGVAEVISDKDKVGKSKYNALAVTYPLQLESKIEPFVKDLTLEWSKEMVARDLMGCILLNDQKPTKFEDEMQKLEDLKSRLPHVDELELLKRAYIASSLVSSEIFRLKTIAGDCYERAFTNRDYISSENFNVNRPWMTEFDAEVFEAAEPVSSLEDTFNFRKAMRDLTDSFIEADNKVNCYRGDSREEYVALHDKRQEIADKMERMFVTEAPKMLASFAKMVMTDDNNELTSGLSLATIKELMFDERVENSLSNGVSGFDIPFHVRLRGAPLVRDISEGKSIEEIVKRWDSDNSNTVLFETKSYENAPEWPAFKERLEGCSKVTKEDSTVFTAQMMLRENPELARAVERARKRLEVEASLDI